MSIGTDWDLGDYQKPQESGLGLASFILSLLAGLIFVGVMVFATYLFMEHGDGLDEESPEMLILGGIFIVTVVMNLVAFILGVVGLMQPDRKRLFSILGVIASAMLFLGGGVLILLGQLAG